MFPNKELYSYMWEHLASTLIGTSANQTFNMYVGNGSNGKSLLVELMKLVLGDYKGDVPLSLITEKRTKIGGLSPELVQLRGVRYAVMQEPSVGDRINEGVMKQLTGSDPLQARAPYMLETISFVPQFKLVVCMNTFMEIKSLDNGTWRRIRVVDFESWFHDDPVDTDPTKPYQFKIDKHLKEKFDTWKEVFASMLVERAFDTNGVVNDCEKVLASSNSYKEKEDHVAQFINDKIIQDPTKRLQKTELNSEFNVWYQSIYGRKGPNMKDVHSYMDKRFGKFDTKQKAWVGIGIVYDREENLNDII